MRMRPPPGRNSPAPALTHPPLAGNCVATGGTDGCIKLWDLRSARIIQYYEAHEGAVTDVSFHPSGNFLLSSAMDSTLKVQPSKGVVAA